MQGQRRRAASTASALHLYVSPWADRAQLSELLLAAKAARVERIAFVQ
ncbi:hypothetical protein [Xanthomonas maliensis]|nr:hypothetical protein [Xanthomonas maliensis]